MHAGIDSLITLDMIQCKFISLLDNFASLQFFPGIYFPSI